MSANRKVILIVILGAGACLLSFLLSQYFSKQHSDNQVLLARIDRLSGQMEHIRLLSKTFIQSGDRNHWRRIVAQLEQMQQDLESTPGTGRQRWQGEIASIKSNLNTYQQILNQIHGPAVRLNEEKANLQGIGLSFSELVEQRIVIPYRKEESLRIYRGDPIDPFKARIKDTANDLIQLHLKQQLILLELLLDWDIEGYRYKKQALVKVLDGYSAQLKYLNVLMGQQTAIQEVLASLNRKLTHLVEREQAILELFSNLTLLSDRMAATGDRLVRSSRDLSVRIVADTDRAEQLNVLLNWGLLAAILAVLGVLGALLARDILAFVEDLSKSRETLKASETNLRVTLNSLGDAVIATDGSGVVTRLNPSAERLTGWPAVEAVGRSLTDVFHIVNAQTRKRMADPAAKVMAEGRTVGLANHTVLIAKDGNEYQIADSGAPICNTEGEMIGVVLVFRDVTESYAQQQRLRESEELLKEITAKVPGVMYRFKATGDHHYINEYISPKAMEIFALEPDPETFFVRFVERIPEVERESFMASVREAVDRVAPWHYEGRFVKPDGAVIWYSCQADPHVVDDGIVFHGMLFDITQRRQLEESLRLTQFCFDKAAIGIYRIGEGGEILNVNDHACRSLGYERDELCRMAIFDIDPDFDPEIWPQHMAGLREAGTRVIESMHRHRSGRRFPVQIVIDIMTFEDQEFHVAFVQDISERKRAEAEAERLSGALVRSQKMEALGTLAGGVAHDFNNILSAVVGYAQLSLLETDAASVLHHNLRQIYAAGMRASDLVRQILAFSRQAKQERQPLQARPLIKEALKLLRSSLPATIEIVQRFGDTPGNLMADPTQLHQIIMNLCTNAAQSMEDGGGRLTVDLSQVDLRAGEGSGLEGLEPGGYVRFSVQDTGHGIAPDILERIFDPYFTTKDSGKGTGLGLSVVQGIVESYGGRVYVDSALGSGTIFTVFLPVIDAQEQTEAKEALQLPAGSETILLVDDEPTLVDVGQQMLEKLGYRVMTCSDSLEAVKLFDAAPETVDLVISDMTMPKLTGDRLAARLLQTRPDLPVILCTGFTNAFTEKDAFELGAKALVDKPLVAEVLATLVRRVLDEAASPAAE